MSTEHEYTLYVIPRFRQEYVVKATSKTEAIQKLRAGEATYKGIDTSDDHLSASEGELLSVHSDTDNGVQEHIDAWLKRVESDHPCQLCGRMAPAYSSVTFRAKLQDETGEDKYAQCDAACAGCTKISVFTLMLR